MPEDDEIESAAEEIGEAVAEITAELIAQEAAAHENALAINEALVDALAETHEAHERDEHRAYISAELNALSEEIRACQQLINQQQTELSQISAEMAAMSLLIPTLSTPPILIPPSEVAEGLPQQMEVETENLSPTEEPQSPPPPHAKRRVRLL